MDKCRHAARIDAAMRAGLPAEVPPDHGPCDACAHASVRRTEFEHAMTAAAESLAVALPDTTLLAARTMPLRTMTRSGLVLKAAPAVAVLVLAIAVGAGIGVLNPRDGERSGSPGVGERVTVYEMPKARRFMLTAACATLRGFPSQYGHASESIQTDFAEFADNQQAIAVMDACREHFDARRALTESEWAALYRQFRDEASCLRGLGYHIDAAPAYENWRRSPDMWDPFVAFAEETITPPSNEVIACSNEL